MSLADDIEKAIAALEWGAEHGYSESIDGEECRALLTFIESNRQWIRDLEAEVRQLRVDAELVKLRKEEEDFKAGGGKVLS